MNELDRLQQIRQDEESVSSVIDAGNETLD
jgi:hypothetical protein